jgi:MFS family permease
MSETITPQEHKTIRSLAMLYALRMLGLFMVMPVMVLHGDYLQGATPQLLGFAIGAYGLTQALFQIPAGLLSDIIGRKSVIVGGLIIFAAGSLLAGMATNIETMIAGRMLQGGGAIASAIMALMTDLTQEHNRTKAMSVIGISIGISFSVALVLGPFLIKLGGLPVIFFVTAALSVLSIYVVIKKVPNVTRSTHRDTRIIWSSMASNLRSKPLWGLNIGIFLLHATLVAVFISIPVQLVEAGIDKAHHAWVYLPVLLVAFALMLPFIIVAEKKQKMKHIVMLAIVIMILSLIGVSYAQQLPFIVFSLLAFFVAFNLLEATVPSWLSKIVPAGSKGSAMGVYSSMQFLGAFVGGWMGANLLSWWGYEGLFLTLSILLVGWIVLVAWMQNPLPLTNNKFSIHKDENPYQLLDKLKGMKGVQSVLYSQEEHAIYIKSDTRLFDYQQAYQQIHGTPST